MVDGMRPTTAAWRAALDDVRAMPLEDARWIKYLLVATVLGGLIELQSRVGGFYAFHPGWLVWVVILGAFGFALGSLAMLLRRTSGLLQFVAGTVLAGGVETLNVAFLHAWTFRAGWPLGITNDWLRAVLLGGAGGLFVLLVNAVLRALYNLRLRVSDAYEP
jgi:hypothetical protein